MIVDASVILGAFFPDEEQAQALCDINASASSRKPARRMQPLRAMLRRVVITK